MILTERAIDTRTGKVNLYETEWTPDLGMPILSFETKRITLEGSKEEMTAILNFLINARKRRAK